MEEFDERVSVIGKSPVIFKIWHFCYRLFFYCVLVLLFISLSLSSSAHDEKVTRMQLVSALYERIYNRQLTELEAINTGLLDAYEDGQFHLEWPVSRGMAAEAFYRLQLQSGNVARLPRAFADIGPESPFKKLLDVVGGAFLPQKHGNFNPNHLLSRKDLFRGIQVLIDKGIVKQEDRCDIDIEIIHRPITTVASATNNLKEVIEIRPELEFKRHSFDAEKFKRQLYKRLERADYQFGSEQMNPQIMGSIEDASAAMDDVEEIMKNLGGSVLEMTNTYPSNPDDERALRQGLAKIEGVLKTLVDRFENSKLQLNTVVPINPDQIKKCTNLNIRLSETIEQAKVLLRRISARLIEPIKGNKP